MFISTADKNAIQESLRALQQRVTELEDHAEKTKVHMEAVTHMYLAKKQPIIPAPWGYKKDGMPKKRPGRPVKTIGGVQP
jgi:hypothetical protein